MTWSGLKQTTVLVVVVAVIFGSTPVLTVGVSADSGIQNPSQVPDNQVFEGSDDGQIEVWNRAAYPIRANDTDTPTQVSFPDTFNGQRLADGGDFTDGNDGTDTKDLNPASFDGERNPAGIHDTGDIFISFNGDRSGSNDLDNEDNVTFLAANITGEGGEGVPADYSTAVDLISDVDKANANASFRVLEDNASLDSNGEVDLTKSFDHGYHVIYASVREDESAGFQVDSENNISVDGDVTIVGVEGVAVQQAAASVTEPSRPNPGDTLDFDVDTTGAFASSADGAVTHTVALYEQDVFENSRVDIVTNESKFGPNFNLSNGSQVEHSIENTTGVADIEDGIEINGVDLSDGRVARFVGMGALIDQFAADLTTNDPSTDPIDQGGSSNSETEDIFASVNATSGQDRDTTVSVETFGNFSTGDYQYIVYSQLDDDATKFSTTSGTITLQSDGGGGGIVSPPSDDEPDVTVTGETSEIEGGETSSGTIGLGNAGETVRFESGATSEGGGATVERVDIELAETVTNGEVEVSTTNAPPAGAPAPDTDQTGEPIGYIETTVQGASDAAITSSTFTFSVSQDRLDRASTDPDDVRLYRVEDDGPNGLPTEHLGGNRFRASTVGFSVFVIGTTPADVSVVSGRLDSTSVGVNEPFTTTVELQNTGGQTGDITLDLEADGDVLTRQTVSVGGSTEQRVDISASIGQAGTYDITVNGNAVGTLDVTGAATPTSTPTATATETATFTADTRTETGDETPTETTTSTPTESTGVFGPGFGVTAALLALLTLGFLVLRRRQE